MSAFYDLASLVVVPSGYKASKVYAQKPLTTDGQLAFTRSTTATRVGPDGLIEKVRTNLALYSEQFDNAAWGKASSGVAAPVVTANQSLAPSGTTSADKIVFPAVSTATDFSVVYNFAPLTTSGSNTASVYLKGEVGGESVYVFMTVGSSYTNLLCTLTTEWQRFSFPFTGGANTYFHIGLDLRTGSGQVAQSGSTIYAWGAQVELGDIATAYIPTTTAAVSVGPVANVPRLDYLNSSCPRLLLEPQRTNLALYSEQFDNAYWTKGNATISANTSATLDPSGFNGADKLQEDSSTNSHSFGSDTASASSADIVTYSIFLKAAERSFAALRLYTGSGFIFGYYNLANGTLGTIGAGGTGTIVSYGNGWYRCSLTITMASSSVTLPYVFTSTGNGVNSYAGTTGSGIYCFGAQQEIAAYATSYIPTLGAAVTRGGDLTKKTSASALIGQTEGTIFGEFQFPNTTITGASSYLGITSGSFANSVLIGREPGSPPRYFFFINAGGTNILSNSANNLQSNTAKLAIGYKSGSWAAYLNGTLVASGTNSFTFGATLSEIAIGPNDSIMTVQSDIMLASQALLFTTRLTNAQLAELTTI